MVRRWRSGEEEPRCHVSRTLAPAGGGRGAGPRKVLLPPPQAGGVVDGRWVLSTLIPRQLPQHIHLWQKYCAYNHHTCHNILKECQERFAKLSFTLRYLCSSIFLPSANTPVTQNTRVKNMPNLSMKLRNINSYTYRAAVAVITKIATPRFIVQHFAVL